MAKIGHLSSQRGDYKAQQDVKEPHVLIVKQPKQRYGEEIKMANQFVMLVVFITNCTMWNVQLP
jgi:hypothetical protein